jgi:NAD-dependent dihydropyrimidine dehydrogenase PreA subunit
MSYLPWRVRRVRPTYEFELFGKVEIDRDKCNDCGLCAMVCPSRGMSIADARGGVKADPEKADFSFCPMSCNDCAAICKKGAIFVTKPYDFGNYYKTLHRGPMVPPRPF